MIITRSPLRITVGGGGVDLPSYYREHGEVQHPIIREAIRMMGFRVDFEGTKVLVA